MNQVEELSISQELGYENFGLHQEIAILRVANDPYDKGIWEKKELLPQWNNIINICKEGLQKSRDLTLGSRLLEALTNKYGIDGLIQGLEIINEICAEDFYPLEEQYKTQIFEWIDTKIPRLVFINDLNYYNQNNNIIKEFKNKILYIQELLNSLPYDLFEFKEMASKIINKIDLAAENHIIEVDVNEGNIDNNIKENNIVNTNEDLENIDAYSLIMQHLKKMAKEDKEKIKKMLSE